MKDFKEFTFGWLIFVLAIPIQLLLTFLYVNNLGDRPLGTAPYIVSMVIFVFICFTLYGLTTKVSSSAITVSFGVGLIRKKILLDRIRSVAIVESPWYYGWGIRLIPNGTLYNISGSHGVELAFKDTDRIIRIGTKDPVTLRKEISRRLA